MAIIDGLHVLEHHTGKTENKSNSLRYKSRGNSVFLRICPKGDMTWNYRTIIQKLFDEF